MVIVSQDETNIINFDCVENIEINTPETWGQGFYSIDTYPNTPDSQKYHIRLGKYKTEERAKEVLNEIIKKYMITECLKTSINRLSDDVGAIALKNAFVYEMPAE